MKRLRTARLLAALACAGLMLAPSTGTAGDPIVPPARVNSALAIEDVALGNGQTFQGVVLAENGEPLADAEVVVSQLGREVARTHADNLGRFAIQNLRGGLHLVRAGQGAALYRFWAADTAPPHARSKVTLVDSVTVRGQRPFKSLLTSKTVVMTLIVGGAVLIPIAVHDARNDKRSGS